MLVPVPWMSKRASAVVVIACVVDLRLAVRVAQGRGGCEEMMMWGFRFMKPPVLKDLMCRGGVVVEEAEEGGGSSSAEEVVRTWVEGEVCRRV